MLYKTIFMILIYSSVYAQSEKISIEIVTKTKDFFTTQISHEIKKQLRQSDILTLSKHGNILLKLIIKASGPLPLENNTTRVYAFSAILTFRDPENLSALYYVDSFIFLLIPELIKQVASNIAINLDEAIDLWLSSK